MQDSKNILTNQTTALSVCLVWS